MPIRRHDGALVTFTAERDPGWLHLGVSQFDIAVTYTHRWYSQIGSRRFGFWIGIAGHDFLVGTFKDVPRGQMDAMLREDMARLFEATSP